MGWRCGQSWWRRKATRQAVWAVGTTAGGVGVLAVWLVGHHVVLGRVLVRRRSRRREHSRTSESLQEQTPTHLARWPPYPLAALPLTG